MKFDKKQLRKLAQDVLELAQANLRDDGYLEPVGLVYTYVGLSRVVPFKYRGLDEKRKSQTEFRRLLVKLKAQAAIVVTESWLKLGPDLPVDLTQSLADLPGRQEAIVIEAASPKAKHIIIQIFSKNETGQVRFETPMEPDHPISWSSEWLDGVWDHYV